MHGMVNENGRAECTWNRTVGSCGKNTPVLGSLALSHPAFLIATRPRAVRATRLTTQNDVLPKAIKSGSMSPHMFYRCTTQDTKTPKNTRELSPAACWVHWCIRRRPIGPALPNEVMLSHGCNGGGAQPIDSQAARTPTQIGEIPKYTWTAACR